MESRKRKDSTALTGESHRKMGVGGAALFLNSTTIELSGVQTAPNSSPSEMSPMRVVSSENVRSLMDW